MLRKISPLILVLIAPFTNAKVLTVRELRERFQLNADIYQTDDSGKKILSGPQSTNVWRMNAEKGILSSEWANSSRDAGFAFKHNWTVGEDGLITVSIEEFSLEKNGNDRDELKESLGKKEFVLEQFSPVSWKVKSIKDKNIIVRFIPSIREVSDPISLDNLPVAGSGISISDNQGFLWAEDQVLSGKYAGIKTHRGLIALSYVSFEGAKEAGFAEGQRIHLNFSNKFQVTLNSKTDFLPSGITAKVYALYLPEKKSRGFNSVNSFDSTSEARFLESLRKK